LRFIDDKKPGYTLKAPAVIHLIPFLKPSLAFINHDRQGGGGAVVESGCKRIYNDQNQYFLDFTGTNYDICIFTRVVVTSTYLYFGVICDIL
jgi:hypothetical protein